MNEPLCKEECSHSCSCPAYDSWLLLGLLKLHTSFAVNTGPATSAWFSN